MTEKFKLALEKYEQDAQLQAEVEKNPPKTKEDIIAIAARVGVELTAEDLDFSQEMSLEDAEQVAGGKLTKDQVKHGCSGDWTAGGCGNARYAACVIGVGAAHWRDKLPW